MPVLIRMVGVRDREVDLNLPRDVEVEVAGEETMVSFRTHTASAS